MTKVRSLVALYYMLTLSGIFGESFRERFFQTTKLRRLTGHLIIRVTTASQLLCVHKCLANTDCRSCNFGVSRKKHNVCELNSLDIAPSAMDKENVFFDKDFVFISMKNVSSSKHLLFYKLGFMKNADENGIKFRLLLTVAGFKKSCRRIDTVSTVKQIEKGMIFLIRSGQLLLLE